MGKRIDSEDFFSWQAFIVLVDWREGRSGAMAGNRRTKITSIWGKCASVICTCDEAGGVEKKEAGRGGDGVMRTRLND
ncbi:hypothetical protein ElyMa_000035900 [Elysia marginata]|uniref:Uncharacterized protein n=1 Tax=Elysia marginata TaxID=1093978 RepID=A0AAV4EDL0_9GAST|nr:hypothetical protein ElyMa_000035900 [Elysia marginata]